MENSPVFAMILKAEFRFEIFRLIRQRAMYKSSGTAHLAQLGGKSKYGYDANCEKLVLIRLEF